MKKYLFLSFVITLISVCTQLQGAVVTAVKAGSVPGTPIDTIRLGEDFGIRIADVTGGNFYLWAVKLSNFTGNWQYDTLDTIFPQSMNVPALPSIGAVDNAFLRISTAGNVWIRIVASVNAPSPTSVGDSSKPLLVMTVPVDSLPIIVYPNPMGAVGSADIFIYTKGTHDYDVKIFDAFGYLVRDLVKDGTAKYSTDATGRYVRAVWDGKNGKGNKVANGIYNICVKAKDAQEAGIWRKKIGVVW